MTSTILDKVDGLFDAEVIETVANAAAYNVIVPNSELDLFILDDINKRNNKHVTWKLLEQCFRWSRIQIYLREIDVHEDAALCQELRSLLVQRKLTEVNYDHRTQKIIKLNYKGI